MILSDIRLLLPREQRPVYDLFTHGPIESLSDYMDVAVEGSVLFPVLRRLEPSMTHYQTTAHIGWQTFNYRHFATSQAFKDPEVRQHISGAVRRALADEIAQAWTINLTATPTPWHLR